MAFSLNDQKIEIPCPQCRRKTAKTIGWIKSNRHFTCICGTAIELDKAQFTREIASVEKALNDFGKKLRF